jgi:hypothetical protein
MVGEDFAIAEIVCALDELDILAIFGKDLKLHIFHRLEDVFEPLCKVVENELPVRFDFLRGEGHTMNKTHLLDKMIPK